MSFFSSLSTVKNRIISIFVWAWEASLGTQQTWIVLTLEKVLLSFMRKHHDQMPLYPRIRTFLFFCFTSHTFISQSHHWIWSANRSWIRLALLHGPDQSCWFCYSSAEKWLALLQLWLGKWWHQHHDPHQNQWWPLAQGNSPQDVGSSLRGGYWVAAIGIPLVPVLSCQCRHWLWRYWNVAEAKNKVSAIYDCPTLENVIKPG